MKSTIELRRLTLLACVIALGPLGLRAAGPGQAAEPPKSWIDPDTGHRVIRLTNEPGSISFYFNVNAYTPDGKRMVYTTPEGISVLDLATHEAHQVVPKPARAIVVATHTATLYYSQPGGQPQVSALWRVNLDTGESSHVADLPPRASIVTINADETLGAGTFVEGEAHAGGAYDGTPRQAPGRMSPTNLGEPANKGEMMTRRLAAKLPMTLFTLDLKKGTINPLLQHDTNWLNHLQFSPTDPTLLLYCHEGHWWLVDRIWTIRTDGTHNQLMHQRHMKMEIAGHEWWGADGQTVYYQLHYPYHGRVSFIASVNVATGAREWLSYAPDESSIHDNSSPDGKMFCGDGDNHSPWIFLFRPHRVPGDDTLGANLIQGGYLESEKLVNMSKHNYRLEPNPTFTPDLKYVVFRSNMFGPDYAFAVEVEKAK
ncbi:MAG TPA: oligogalacturonate lyase family protein [Lacunisphaera sp.]|jgi:oligogalacturonide lyase|nr:oligogalacturonate lyase family protein [Lacunisphaera sp.]